MSSKANHARTHTRAHTHIRALRILPPPPPQYLYTTSPSLILLYRTTRSVSRKMYQDLVTWYSLALCSQPSHTAGEKTEEKEEEGIGGKKFAPPSLVAKMRF